MEGEEEEDDAEVEEEQVEAEEEEDDAEPEKEEEDPAPPAAGFGMPEALAELEVAQAAEAAEQQAILDSLHSEAEVEANRRILRQWQADIDEMFVDLKEEEEPELPHAAIDPESGIEIVDTFNDE